jgi:hypothetical protein
VTHDDAGRDADSRIWRNADGVHIDVRGLNPPEPMIAILQLLDASETATVIAHLDREPIFLYPELDERGWGYEMLPSQCGDESCDHDIRLRLVRLHP